MDNEVGCFVGIVVGIILLVFGLAYFVTMYSCTVKGNQTGLATKFSFWGSENGCLVRVKDQWIPTENWINNSGN